MLCYRVRLSSELYRNFPSCVSKENADIICEPLTNVIKTSAHVIPIKITEHCIEVYKCVPNFVAISLREGIAEKLFMNAYKKQVLSSIVVLTNRSLICLAWARLMPSFIHLNDGQQEHNHRKLK